MSEPVKASELCKSAIVIDPDHWAAWKNMGMALEAMDRSLLTSTRELMALDSTSLGGVLEVLATSTT
jgi:hypothetical protein